MVVILVVTINMGRTSPKFSLPKGNEVTGTLVRVIRSSPKCLDFILRGVGKSKLIFINIHGALFQNMKFKATILSYVTLDKLI